MAELAYCPLCGPRNMELREAVCDQDGNLVCTKCGRILEKA